MGHPAGDRAWGESQCRLNGSSLTSTPPMHVLRATPAGWQEELDERTEMEGTLADGLDEL
jgi:hypothetical protein